MTVAGQTEQTARHRSQLFPLRLNRAQKAYMAQAAGCARFAYNWALEQWKLQAKAWWDSGKVSPFPTAFTLNKQFNAVKDEQFPWFREVSCHPAQSAIIGVGEAMANYRSGNTRYPRFHARGGRTSFVASPNRREFKIDGKHIVLPRVGRLRLGAAARWPDAPATRASPASSALLMNTEGDRSKRPTECREGEIISRGPGPNQVMWGSCPHLKEVSSSADMDGETYDCAVCGRHYRLYYEDMA